MDTTAPRAQGLTQSGEEQAHHLPVGGQGRPDARVDGQVGEHAGQLDEHVLPLGLQLLWLGLLLSIACWPLGVQVQLVEGPEQGQQGRDALFLFEKLLTSLVAFCCQVAKNEDNTNDQVLQ